MQQRLNELLKRKSVQAALLAFSLLFSAWCIYDFAQMVKRSHAQGVVRDVSAAVKELQGTQPGIPRAEAFLRRLTAIHTGYAPEEVKIALQDYTSALEKSLVAMKGGYYTNQFDADMAAAREKLLEATRRWN
jgi:hypothetical protein